MRVVEYGKLDGLKGRKQLKLFRASILDLQSLPLISHKKARHSYISNFKSTVSLFETFKLRDLSQLPPFCSISFAFPSSRRKVATSMESTLSVSFQRKRTNVYRPFNREK